MMPSALVIRDTSLEPAQLTLSQACLSYVINSMLLCMANMSPLSEPVHPSILQSNADALTEYVTALLDSTAVNRFVPPEMNPPPINVGAGSGSSKLPPEFYAWACAFPFHNVFYPAAWSSGGSYRVPHSALAILEKLGATWRIHSYFATSLNAANP
jgi:hypothetical protein